MRGCVLLVTLDIAVLYSNIPHKKGIKVIGDFLLPDPSMPTAQKQFLTDGLDFKPKHNYFMFNIISNAKVLMGTMGTKCAPVFANLYIGSFKEEYIYGN